MHLSQHSETKQVPVRGGEYNSLFRRLEEALIEKQVLYMEALEYVEYGKRGKSIDDYRSVVDFLFCELISQYRLHCQLFYFEMGSSLADMLRPHPKFVRHFERLLLSALEIAFQMMRDEEPGGWDAFLQKFLSSALISDEPTSLEVRN